jgi:hypothetical protein
MFRLFEHQILPGAYSHGSGSMSTEAIFGSSKTEKINQFLTLMKDPDVQPTFRIYIENILATSELNILKRLKTIEKILELNDYPIEDDEAESTIPKQIFLLSNQMKEVIKTNNKQSIMEPIPKAIHIGMSKTTARAILLFKDVVEVAIEGKDKIVIGSREIKDFLTNHIQPEYRIGNVSNFRKVKKDVLTTLKKLLPDNVLLDKKKYGRREIRLVYGT